MSNNDNQPKGSSSRLPGVGADNVAIINDNGVGDADDVDHEQRQLLLEEQQRQQRLELVRKRKEEMRRKAMERQSSGGDSLADPTANCNSNSNSNNSNNYNNANGDAFSTSNATPIRESVVENAVNFLTNPRIRSAPASQKTEFLQKKGLSSSEITEALKRASAVTSTTQTARLVLFPIESKSICCY
jgi:hypothetical protein